MQTATSVRFDPETLAALDGLATTLGRPRSWVIQEAVRQYLEYDDWFRQAVAEGQAALAEGRVVSQRDVLESLKGIDVHVD
ncbi:CopG family ribbon-helix-helix protein [Solidesulfovibrio sp.]